MVNRSSRLACLLTLWIGVFAVDASAEAPPALPCADGWFTIRATIVALDGPDQSLRATSARGARPVGLHDVLCAGEILEVDARHRVEVLESGSVRTVTPPGHRVGAAPATAAAASKYVGLLFEMVRGLRPPLPRAAATGARGGRTEAQGYEAVRLLAGLRNVPRQRVTLGQPVLLAWRGGVAPYRCTVSDDTATELWQSETVAGAWCEGAKFTGAASRLSVVDAQGVYAGVNVTVVEWAVVPRPPWGSFDPTTSSTTDMTAWAAWLWRSAPAEWRLQGLTMLQALGAQEVVSANLLERALDENLPWE